jgi:hypothetical protein
MAAALCPHFVAKKLCQQIEKGKAFQKIGLLSYLAWIARLLPKSWLYPLLWRGIKARAPQK